ncbi:CHAT domain-containing protein [Streptomyces albidoflavus]|uniref:CHAT domain-containing protein n=3 Tax=Streptomyces TaxID=1883 RepID=A0AB37XDH4_9ACTN|nr:CHAT domain-containing protein [Streptomyces albidoflavus]QLA58785.1 CHAT domain-containing protein [Streptomyces violascens]RZE36214.1 CHAT domain-containing protein [Streptomyces albidoflavus]
MNDALEIPSPAELYAAYEEVVAQARAGGAGQVPARWADAGRIAYLLYVTSQDPSAARLCQEAYMHLFPPPGTEAASPGGAEVDALPRHRVLAAFAGNQVHAEGEGDQAALAHSLALAHDGLDGLDPDDPADVELIPVAVFVLGHGGYRFLERYGPPGDAEDALLLLDEVRDALELLRGRPGFEGDEQQAELGDMLGHVALLRVERTGDRETAEEGLAHYRAARSLQPDHPRNRRLAYASALFPRVLAHFHGDPDALRRSRTEVTAALDEARGLPEEEGWQWPARVEAARTGAELVLGVGDRGLAGTVEEEITGLLDDPRAGEFSAATAELLGRLLHHRAQERADQAGLDRACGLLRHALRRWDLDRPAAHPCYLLAITQQSRYLRDPRPERLTDILLAARRMRADAASSGRWGEEVAELGPLADKLGGFARELLLGHGWSADHPDLVPFAGVDWQAELGDIVARTREGRLGMDFSDTLQDGPYPGSLPDIAQLTGDLGERVEEWERLPEGPERSRQAAVLMGTLSLTDPHHAHLSQEQRDRLAEAASAGPDGTAPDPGLRTQLEALLAMNALHSEQGAPGLDAILERMARARAAADPGTGKLLGVMEVLATARRAGASRTTDDLEEALRGWEELRPGHGLGEVLGELMDAQVTALVRLPLALRHRDLPAVDDCLGHLQETFDGLPPGHDAHAELASQLALARAQRDSLAASLGLPADDAHGTAPAPDVAEVREAVARLSRAERAAALASHASSRLAVLARDDGAGPLDEVEALFQEAYELVEEGSDDRLQHAFGLAAVHLLRAVRTGTRLPARRTAQRAALDLLGEVLAGAKGPEHRLHADAALSYGRTLRTWTATADDLALSRRAGLSALRGHAWRALVQSGTAHTTLAARDTTDAALEVAGWCLADDAPEQAFKALDACRGLALHAAVTTWSVPARLRAAATAGPGAPDPALLGLVADWEAAVRPTPGQETPSVPSALRRRVLDALAAHGGSGDRLLEPPSPDDAAEALRRAGHDALVYLVAGDQGRGGHALILTRKGELHTVRLPRLNEDAPPLRAHLDAQQHAARDLGPAPAATPPPGPAPRRTLDDLAAWAWPTAVGPLLAELAPAGRPPRLVLVPMGALGVVPWHAAWTGTGRRRYALQEAEFSYAASARLYCESAARAPATGTGPALVVGDPTGDLPGAGEEAVAVHRAFHPDGRYLGRRSAPPPDGPGTPAEVLAWLRSTAGAGAPPGAGVLHLACHATVTPTERHSAGLELAGGRLTAEELTEAAEAAGARLGLVVLAACRSHVSGRGHNEAYSLATAFLVAGAHTVLGSLWQVPDDATSVLMYLTHRHLREGDPSVAALRRAQLVLVDPGRAGLGELPPALAARAARIDPDDLTGWAAFAHLGR